MFGLTQLGVLHTAVSLVAVAAAIVALARHKEITTRQRAGQVYIASTVIACLTGFGIFQHGGFGPPHALGILTLIALGLAYAAGRGAFGRASRRLEIVAYTLTVFFHSIPGVTESLTRLPPGAPIAPSQEAPIFPVLYGIFFVIFLVGVTLQVRWLKAHEPVPHPDWDEDRRPAA
jgi:uncharacterized membrane protein